MLRIATWNIANRRLDARHHELMLKENCDIWLLTEINPNVVEEKKIIGFNCHLSKGVMGRNQHWAAVLSKQTLIIEEDPHAASAVAIANGITYCSTILPWKVGCGTQAFSVGVTLEEMQQAAINALVKKLRGKSPLVWGGDWNQNLDGGWENVGTIAGKTFLAEAVKALDLQVPTIDLQHMNPARHTIDHIAVPSNWTIVEKKHIPVGRDGTSLSDHNAYLVEVKES